MATAVAARPADRARDEASRHSRRVRRLRFWLPLAGGLAALAVAGWIAWTSFSSHFGLANVLFTRDGVTMVDPHISGRSQGRAYEMQAKRGIQAFDNAKKVRFEEVTARVEMPDRRWVTLTAPIGIFDGTAQTLHLEGGVDVVTSEGYHVVTQSVDMALDKGDIRSADAVRVDTGSEMLDAGAAAILESGHRMVFSGGIRLSLTPKARTVAPVDAAPEKDTP
jgi:lipopolysaccharide export system protein LptC